MSQYRKFLDGSVYTGECPAAHVEPKDMEPVEEGGCIWYKWLQPDGDFIWT